MEVDLCKNTLYLRNHMHLQAKHVCAESYAKETQFDDETDDRDKLEEDSPDYEGDNT